MVKGKLRRIIIAAVAKNRIIGNENQIPWEVKEELEHFKKTTTGYPVIFGRSTFDSIGKSLRNRLNIVITNNIRIKNKTDNLLYFESVKKAYSYLRKNNYKKVFICGGGIIYRNTIKHVDEMIISHMNFEISGDTKFPLINSKLWKVKNRK